MVDDNGAELPIINYALPDAGAVDGAGPTDAPAVGAAWTNLSAGYSHLPLRSDGKTSCWGDDYYGESTPPAGAFTCLRGELYACGLRATALSCAGAPA